jgi:Phage integrase family
MREVSRAQRAHQPHRFHRLIRRVGEAAKMPFPVHPHVLRHACGFKLANDGHDTRALQHYVGHKTIQHTVRYTELSPDRFRISGVNRSFTLHSRTTRATGGTVTESVLARSGNGQTHAFPSAVRGAAGPGHQARDASTTAFPPKPHRNLLRPICERVSL